MRTQLICILSSLVIATAHAQRSDLSTFVTQNEGHLYDGAAEKFVEILISAAGTTDSKRLLFAGNVLHQISLAPAIKLHLAAQALEPNDRQISVELVYDYVASGECLKANAELEKLDRKVGFGKQERDPLDSRLAAVASYCALETGDEVRAVQLWTRANYRNSHLSIDEVIGDVFGRTGPIALQVHADGFKRYQDLGWQASGTWIRNAYQWKVSWWQMEPNKKAIAAMRATLQKNRDRKALHELDCLDASIDGANSSSAPITTEKKKLHCDWRKVPSNSGVAYLYAVHNTDKPALAKSWSKTLEKRARSTLGDLDAIELVAFFYTSTHQTAKLAEMDELGWQRYRLVGFAISALARKGALEGALDQSQQALSAKALIDFPQEPRLLMNDMLRNHSKGEAYKRALIRLILAEFKTPRFSSQLSSVPNARGINEFFVRLAGVLKKLEEGKEVSVFDQ